LELDLEHLNRSHPEHKIIVAKGQIFRLLDRIAILEQSLAEALDQVESQRNAALANAQILKGEEHSLTRVLGYLEKIQGVMNDADQDFNFSGNYDPDDSPR
jgi:hypothetical protein